MLIALDYDGTYTADPRMWRTFCTMAQSLGHSFVCVTGRAVPPDFTRDPPLPQGMPIVCAPEGYKRNAALRAGFKVDVWIDDIPEMIGPSKVLDFSGDCPCGEPR